MANMTLEQIQELRKLEQVANDAVYGSESWMEKNRQWHLALFSVSPTLLNMAELYLMDEVFLKDETLA